MEAFGKWMDVETSSRVRNDAAADIHRFANLAIDYLITRWVSDGFSFTSS